LSPLTTSINLSSNKIQIGDILVLANPGPPGKMAIKMERYIAQDWDKEENTITRRPESIHNVQQYNQNTGGKFMCISGLVKT